MKAPLLIVAATIALATVLASCGDAGEELAPVITASPSPSGITPLVPTPTPVIATPAPVPSEWEEYTSVALKFSVAHAADLTVSQRTSELREQKGDSVIQQRVVTFTGADGVFAFYVTSGPNDAGLSLEQWIKTYPGWPTEPQAGTIGGQAALRFDRNALDEPDARVYVVRGATVYTLAGNVFGSGEGGYGPGIQESDFETVLQSFRFAE